MKLNRIASIGALALTATVLAACGGVAIDSAKIQDSIKAGVSEQAGADVTVTCPTDIKVETGYVFTCEIKAADGQTQQVQVTETDDQGNISWETVPNE